MSKATTLQDILKSLPAVTDTSRKSVLLTDTSGAMSKLQASAVPTIAKSAEPAAPVPGEWIRIACLGTYVNRTVCHARFMITTAWYSTVSRFLDFDLFLAAAYWNWNSGNTYEIGILKKGLDTSPGVFDKIRIVVEDPSSTRSIYLELHTASGISDIKRPTVSIQTFQGNVTPMNPVSGNIPTGALSREIALS